jgi:DNA-binding HxlR family transcriptional regulator
MSVSCPRLGSFTELRYNRKDKHWIRQQNSGSLGYVTSDSPTITRALPVDVERCSILGTLDALGDSWSVLVLRQLFYGVHRFNEIQDGLGISRSVLADRLTRLAELDVVRAVPYKEPGTRARHEYRLTRKGVALLPVMVALMEWGDEHVYGGNAPVVLRERTSGEQVRLELRTSRGPVAPSDIVPTANSTIR